MTDLLAAPVNLSPLEKVEAALTAAGWTCEPTHPDFANTRTWRKGVGGSRRSLCLSVDNGSGLVEISDMLGSSAQHRLAGLGLVPSDLLMAKESFPNGRLVAAMEAGEPLPDTLPSMVISRMFNAGAASNPVWAEVRKVIAAAMSGDIGLIGTAVGEMTVNVPDLADWAQESWFVAGTDDPEPSTTSS